MDFHSLYHCTEMSFAKLFIRNPFSVTRCRHIRRYTTSGSMLTNSSSEFSDHPEYPPIEFRSQPTIEKQKWYDKIKRLKTVEEKLFEVNVQRKWGWKSFIVKEGIVPLNSLTFAQHMTKTSLKTIDKLPNCYDQYAEKSRMFASQIKNDVIDGIEYQLDVRHPKLSEFSESLHKEKEITKIIISELNRIFLNRLWTEINHLKFVQVDYSPRIEASWKIESLVETYVREVFEHGIPPDEIPEEYLDRPSDKYIQYLGSPILQLRASHPLPKIIDKSESLILEYPVPEYKYDPHVLGYELDRRYQNNIPGYWPGDDKEFSFLSFHSTNAVKYRSPSFGFKDPEEAIQNQAIFASFGWLFPIACFQGFSSYHDITYPLVTQTVLTNGREFTFALYQLNTTEMYHKNLFENVFSNICWITQSKPLYEVLENGKIKGFNDEVLEKLISLYLNSPQSQENVEMKPYLGKEIKYVTDYEDDEKVEWLDEKYKECCSNKPWTATHLMYEVHDWERIFKIQFCKRQLDARRRPFERKEQPYHEKITYREYIPRKERPDKDLPKWRQKRYRRTYFPE